MSPPKEVQSLGGQQRRPGTAPADLIGHQGCRTRQPAAWPSSQRRMFSTVS
jgi:hypothetical protein